MGIEPWEVLDSKYLHERARVDICRVNGKTIEPVMLEFGTWVTIVAITKNKEVVLVRQYRHGVQKILLRFAYTESLFLQDGSSTTSVFCLTRWHDRLTQNCIFKGFI